MFYERLVLVFFTFFTLTLGSTEQEQKQELSRLKRQILEGLGLDKIPDVSKMNVSREEYERMHYVYLQSIEEQRRKEKRSDPIQRFLTFSHNIKSAPTYLLKQKSIRNQLSWLYFPIKIKEKYIKINSASLRFLLIWPSVNVKSTHDSILINVYQDLGNSQRKLIDQKKISKDLAATRWTELNVKKAVESWVIDSNSNYGLQLECIGCRALGATIDTQERRNDSLMGPALNIITLSQSSVRNRRSADTSSLRRTNCSANGERCCRHSMKVIFKDLEDFDFILQPLEYDAGYCKGRCPPRFNPASHHALLQGLVWKKNRKHAPRPCCAPSKLRSLQMLVLDPDDPSRLSVVSWTEMEVEECACT